MVDFSHIALQDRDVPVILLWPASGNAGAFRSFGHPAAWRTFIEGFGINQGIPQIIQAKFARAQTLYLLSWIDITLIKAGELAALVALELAVMDRYGGKVFKG